MAPVAGLQRDKPRTVFPLPGAGGQPSAALYTDIHSLGCKGQTLPSTTNIVLPENLSPHLWLFSVSLHWSGLGEMSVSATQEGRVVAVFLLNVVHQPVF